MRNEESMMECSVVMRDPKTTYNIDLTENIPFFSLPNNIILYDEGEQNRYDISDVGYTAV